MSISIAVYNIIFYILVLSHSMSRPSATPSRLSGSTQPPVHDVAELIRDVRNQVLRGHFTETCCDWQAPLWKLLIFVSSTFTDTHIERDILMTDILPDLRKAAFGQVDVTFVDMRWGIRDEGTLKHRTWIECSRELERCRQQSDGLFFISLQGNK